MINVIAYINVERFISILGSDFHFFVQLCNYVCLPPVLELWGTSLFKQVLSHDCEILMEFTRAVHSLHILLNGGVFLDLGVVSEVFEVSVAVGVAADLFLLVHVPLVVVLLIKNEFVNFNRLIFVFLLKDILINVWLFLIQILGLQGFVCHDFLHLGPHFFKVLVGKLLRIKSVLIRDFFEYLLKFFLFDR